MYAKRKIII